MSPTAHPNSAPSTGDEPEADKPIPGLLAELGAMVPEASRPGVLPVNRDAAFENRLAMVRLGMATALYYALRAKHPPTAAHSLRVAIGCSAWAERLQLPADSRDRIEVAALLHDIGKIGIPDAVLRKPGKLTVSEQLTMDMYPQLGCEILSGCTNDADLLDIVRYSHAWYDSRREDDSPRGQALPLGTRMLAIVGAFDAMTTDHVYRPAMSRERAMGELLGGSGSQFDPELVHDYCRMLESHPETLQAQVVTRWLRQLSSERNEGPWGIGNGLDSSTTSLSATKAHHEKYHRQLFDHMHDGVVFIDRNGIVIGWNRSLERLSGVSANAVCDHIWAPELLGMCDNSNKPFEAANCPLMQCLRSGVYSSRQLRIRSSDSKHIPVHLHVSAVVNAASGIQGAMAVLHDASRQTSLEERLVDLHEKATKDALTGVDNRGQFDAALAELTELATNGGPTFGLIICDIDRFKQINDVHGHQAGDAALVSFARVLKAHARDGDIVCRYGGEEFCIISPSSDNPTATRRAESIRAAIEQTPIDSLEGNAMTASFGVTEFQAGDSPETVLARADRALLRAKDSGRNRVIQLGAGRAADVDTPEPKPSRLGGWFSWFESAEHRATEVRVLTPVPADLAIEKLRGFIADHNAEVVTVSDRKVMVRLNVLFTVGGRRRVDHRISFELSMQLSELKVQDATKPRRMTQTAVDVNLRPLRSRDRRRRELDACANRVIASLRSYLMGTIIAVTNEEP